MNSNQSGENVDYVVIPKVIQPPDSNMGEFDALIEQARKQAKEAGLKQNCHGDCEGAEP